MSLFLPFLVGALVGLTAALAGAALTRRRRRTRWDTASFDDHTDQALAVVADDLTTRRLDQAIRRHPAGRTR